MHVTLSIRFVGSGINRTSGFKLYSESNLTSDPEMKFLCIRINFDSDFSLTGMLDLAAYGIIEQYKEIDILTPI